MSKIIEYDKNIFNFENILLNLFSVSSLENLHDSLDKIDNVPTGEKGLSKDTHSKYHKLFFDNLKSGFEQFEHVYKSFVSSVIGPYFCNQKKIIYQKYPSFRIQYPGQMAVTTKHYDHDKNHKHPVGELNVFLPITRLFPENTMWIESLPGLGDFHPVLIQPNQALLWNGNMCRHYNKKNDLRKTRVSFDFRVMSLEYYDKNYQKTTATMKQKFVVGEYYEEIIL